MDIKRTIRSKLQLLLRNTDTQLYGSSLIHMAGTGIGPKRLSVQYVGGTVVSSNSPRKPPRKV